MPVYRVTFKFTQDSQGWFEIYTWSGGSSLFTDFTADVNRLSKARLAFLHKTATLNLVVAKQLDTTPGVKTPITQFVSSGPGLAPDAAGTPGVWRVNLLANQDTTGAYKNRQYLRGVPSAWWGYRNLAPALFTFNDSFLSIAEAFNNLLKPKTATNPNNNNGSWVIPARSKAGVDTSQEAITAIGTHTTGGVTRFTVTVAEPTAFTQGATVYIHNVKGQGLNGINGTTTIIDDLGGGVFEIAKSPTNTCSIVWNNKGVMGLVVNKYWPIGQSAFARGIIRDTGKPAATTRGRSGSKRQNAVR